MILKTLSNDVFAWKSDKKEVFNEEVTNMIIFYSILPERSTNQVNTYSMNILLDWFTYLYKNHN